MLREYILKIWPEIWYSTSILHSGNSHWSIMPNRTLVGYVILCNCHPFFFCYECPFMGMKSHHKNHQNIFNEYSGPSLIQSHEISSNPLKSWKESYTKSIHRIKIPGFSQKVAVLLTRATSETPSSCAESCTPYLRKLNPEVMTNIGLNGIL